MKMAKRIRVQIHWFILGTQTLYLIDRFKGRFHEFGQKLRVLNRLNHYMVFGSKLIYNWLDISQIINKLCILTR